MVGTHRAVEADVVERLHDLVHVEGAVAGQVRGLLELGVAEELQVAHVREVDAALERADDLGQVVLAAGAQRAGAQGHAVVRVVHHLQHAVQVLAAGDDARQAEHAPGRVVRMNGHIDVVLVAHGHDGLEEVLEVGEQRFVVHALVDLKQRLDLLHALGLPAGQDVAVGVRADRGEHVLGIERVHLRLVVGQHGGAVPAGLGQIGARPVKDRHEVVAHHVDVLFAQRGQGLDVVVDVHVAAGQARLDVVVYVDALDAADVQAARRHLVLERPDRLARPGLAGLGGVQGGDHARHPGNLANLLQRHAVIAGAVPAQCHFHGLIPPFICAFFQKYRYP